MIRRFAHIDAPPSLVRRLFLDAESWPSWMPGVVAVRSLEESPEGRSIEVTQRQLGRRFVQRLSCRQRDDAVIHEQVSGWLKSWRATWRVDSAPDGDGAVLDLELRIELGMFGMLLPNPMRNRWLNGLVDDTFQAVRERAGDLLAEQPRRSTGIIAAGEPIVQVFETASGFEVRLAGRRFHIEAAPRR